MNVDDLLIFFLLSCILAQANSHLLGSDGTGGGDPPVE